MDPFAIVYGLDAELAAQAAIWATFLKIALFPAIELRRIQDEDTGTDRTGPPYIPKGLQGLVILVATCFVAIVVSNFSGKPIPHEVTAGMFGVALAYAAPNFLSNVLSNLLNREK